MRIIVPGHVYELENIDGPGVQRVEFVLRRDLTAELLPPEDRSPGLMTQEVLRMLIDRTIYLNAEQAWHENITAVNALRETFRCYERRASSRSIDKLGMPERAPHCSNCGHIFCFCR